MTSRLSSSIRAALLFLLLFLSVAVPSYAQTPLTLRPGTSQVVGTISVYVRNEQGESLPVAARITLSLARPGLRTPFSRALGNNFVFSEVPVGDDYQVDVIADGYQPARKTVSLGDMGGSAAANVIVFMRPLNQELEFHPPAGQFTLAPSTQKEVEKGLKDLRSDRIPSAQKHFQKALAMAPENPYVNYAMGMSYLVAMQLPQARPYLEKSVSMDPKQPASLLAIGSLRFESTDYAGAIQSLSQDVELDPSSWKAEWMLADSYLHQRDFAQARRHAERSLAIGKQKAMPVQVVLGQALAGLGDREGAVKTLESYLLGYPDDPRRPSIEKYIANLEKPPALVEMAAQASTTEGHPVSASSPEPSGISIPAPPVELPPKETWAPADVDVEKPFVISGAACPVAEILDRAGKNAVQLVSDLQSFSAVEEYQAVEVRRDETLERPVARTFSYLVSIETPSPRLIEVKEIRDDDLGPALMPGRLADNGAPGLLLAFHPVYRDDFAWRCEGLGEWKEQPAWLIHFEQRGDRPTSLLASFDTPAQEFALPLKGRAWISTKTGQVVRLEADLVRPVEPVDLKRQHFIIDYAPVNFRSHQVTLWLPESVDVYIQYQGHYLHHQHHFSNFKLVWVGTSQKIGAPKQPATVKQNP